MEPYSLGGSMPAGSYGHDMMMDSLCEEAGREEFYERQQRKYKMAVISGEAKWASVIKPNTTFEIFTVFCF